MPQRRLHLLSRLAILLPLLLSLLLTTAGDWPTFLHDPQRGAASPDETLISPSSAPQLTPLWAFKTGNTVYASPTVVGGVVYVGSSDGYEYALDAATGALKWRTYLGQIFAQPSCIGGDGYQGVTSAAAVQNGVVYVGGGGDYWYALDAGTGNVLWKIYTGDSSQAGGHYNWASPLLYNGYAYIGIASLCDEPLVQGQLLKVNLSTHQVEATFNAVPSGQVGGGIWTSPSIDTATNTIYVTTGTNGTTPTANQPQSLAMVALDATTLNMKGSWQVPPSQQTTDSDWGTTPILFSDAQGHQLVAGINKGGWLYTFDRTNVSAGPLWQRQVANGGPNPTTGDGSISSGTFGGGMLYFAGGNTTVGTTPYSGSVRAFDPATGQVLWEQGTAGTVGAALAYANGVVVDAARSTLEVRNAATGSLLYSYHTGGPIYSAPSIANGRIYAGSNDGYVYAFGFPNSGAYAGSIAGTGGAASYTFTPNSGGSAVAASCATASGATVAVSLYDGAGALLAAGGAATCSAVSAALAAGQSYTVKTLMTAGSGGYTSAWSVNQTPVVWNLYGSGYTIGTPGGVQYLSFVALGTLALSSCGPPNSNYDLYLVNANNVPVASSTSPSTCESLTYAPSSLALYRLKEVAVSGTGAWTGMITSTVTSAFLPPTATPQPATNTPLPTATNTPPPTSTATPLPSATNTPVPVPATNTPAPIPPTSTNAPLPTNTPPISTLTPTSTATPTLVPPSATPSARQASPTAVPPTATPGSGATGSPPAHRTPPAPRLSVAIEPRVARPGDMVTLRVRYAAHASVRVVFTYTPPAPPQPTPTHGHKAPQRVPLPPSKRVTVQGRTDGRGRLALRLRVPALTLRNGHGTASLRVDAAAGRRHAALTTRLMLSNMILSADLAPARSCRQSVTVRVAFTPKTRVRLTLRYLGRPRTVTLTTDRAGRATTTLSLLVPADQAAQPHVRETRLLIEASGRHGSLRQTERLWLTPHVPRGCQDGSGHAR